MNEATTQVACSGERLIGRIPIRNLWLLMLYASELVQVLNTFDALTDEDIDNLPDLIARLLAKAVELRLRRNLTRSYQNTEMALTRVRGRIDVLETEARQLLSRGEVYCRFEELSSDTPRNRLVRGALELMSRLVSDATLKLRCRSLAAVLSRAGVARALPSRAELATDTIGRNDAADRFIVALAKLSFNIALPTESAGSTPLYSAAREEVWARKLFEKAVLGFARVEFVPLGWTVRGGVSLNWQTIAASEQLCEILPRMVTDIMLDSPDESKRVVIDTKFASILRKGYRRESTLSSSYLYQIYAYIRSQEGSDERWNSAAGMLLHPAIDVSLNERVVIQGHPISFNTIDLSGSAQAIRSDLRQVLQGA